MKAKKLTKETINSLGIIERQFPNFQPGDTIAVSTKIVEAGKERTQIFQGDVIAIHKKGASSSFIVRKIASNGIAVERIFPFYSPKIALINLIKKGKVRRAKLFYLRDRVGKSAKIKEKIVKKVKKVTNVSEVPVVEQKSESTISQAK